MDQFTSGKELRYISCINSNLAVGQCRPKPGANDPFHLISNDTKAIKAMKLAELKPQLAMLSDWDHLTSEEYFAAQVKTGLDIL